MHNITPSTYQTCTLAYNIEDVGSQELTEALVHFMPACVLSFTRSQRQLTVWCGQAQMTLTLIVCVNMRVCAAWHPGVHGGVERVGQHSGQPGGSQRS